MLQLTDREWSALKVKNIFPNIEKCKCSNNSLLKSGNFPYVGATNKNNGIMRFVEKIDWLITKGNCIVFICDGQGSVGYSMYKSEDFIGSTTLKAARNLKLNRYNAQFIVSALDKNRTIYSYGYKRTEQRLLNEIIMLPVDEQGNPDYAFMEQYIKERERQLIQKYKAFIGKNIQAGVLKPLNEVKWKVAVIGDLFEVKRPKPRSEKQYPLGNVPFVASGNVNNGVIKCCAPLEDESLDRGNCVTVSPVDGSTFYQKADFLGRGGAGSSVLLLYNNSINRYSGLFLSRLIRQTCSKYCYGKMGSQEGIRREKIMLPVDEQGNPDYSYMEQYGRKIMLQKYQQYLAYIGEHNITQ